MIERKAFTGETAASEAGAFVARVYQVGAAPDGDGDVILAVPPAGHKVMVSLGEHDALLQGAAPAGEGALFEVGGTVIAHGRAFDSPRGAALQTKLRNDGPNGQWSIGWYTSPDKGFRSRRPTAAELKRWPDARRIITAWVPVEISPVRTGSCGPACRTISAKCVGNTCACTSKPRTPDPAVVKAAARARAHTECLKERHGADAWLAAQDGARWLTGGVLQEGPGVGFVPFDGKRLGYWRPGDDVVYVARGLSLKQTISTVMHETSHWWRNWDASEESARFDADWLTRRYFERLAA